VALPALERRRCFVPPWLLSLFSANNKHRERERERKGFSLRAPLISRNTVLREREGLGLTGPVYNCVFSLLLFYLHNPFAHT